ncbi:MAG: sigma-70 family RNA polymerase sigma factor [Planctomycetes bacterium]|nr:sigma-70 family RNA polymerase sigma factor [Planctomycetota bacterium]
MNTTIAKLNRLGDPLADGPLLDAFLSGDQAAFAALVRRYAGLVFATCRRVLRHQQDAEDAFQATFLVLARRAGDVWPREAVGSWLFGVAHRVALKARAARDRRAVRRRPLEDAAPAAPPPPDFDLAEAVHRVVCRLPEVYRAAVVACDLEGLSRKEAAARLGWTEGTLSGRLARARELLASRFRRLGLTLPAGGLAAACVGPESAPAASVQAAIDLATGTGTAPAPVVALTEGVVRSMGLFKLKAMTAAMFVACAVGFGALAAGNGDGSPDGPPSKPTQEHRSTSRGGSEAAVPPVKAPAPPKGPRVDLARQELEVLLQEIEFAAVSGKLDKSVLDRLRGRLRAADRLLDANDLALEFERPAKSLTDHDRLQGKWRVVSLTENGKTAPTDPKDPWVMEFASRTFRMPFFETDGGWTQREYVFALDTTTTPRTIELFAPNKPIGRAVYEFTAPAKTCQSCHEAPNAPAFGGGRDRPADAWLGLCAPGLKIAPLGVRLGLAPDGRRGITFDTPGVIVFDLRRPSADRVAEKTDPRIVVNQLAALAAEVERAQLESERAKLDLAAATAELEKARHTAAQAQARWAAANQKWQLAQREYERASERLKKLPAVAPGGAAAAGEVFAVHIRTLAAAEKVIRVKATGKETVLAGLVYAADDVSIKSDALSVWVVRDGAVLAVDLPAILKGDTKTNYALKVGDQLFVQVKPAK